MIGDLLSEIHRLGERIATYDRHIAAMARQDHYAQQLMRLRGIGETTATALVAMVGNGRDFRNGRQLSAWIGLVPGQNSSGGKTRLGRITKSGDAYLRSLLIMGARGAERGQGQDGQREPLGAGTGRAGRLLEGGGGDRSEERAHGLGDAAPGRAVRSAGLRQVRSDADNRRENSRRTENTAA